MIDINPKPPENLPFSTSPDEPDRFDEYDAEESQTLLVPPPTLRERIQAAQRARTLQIQPSIDMPESELSDNGADPANPAPDA